MQWTLVIPLKPLALAKSRLADTAADGLRPGLALAFAEDTVAAALASAATGHAPPEGAAFVGEIALTGQVRAAPALEQRVAAARAAGCSTLFGPERAGPLDGLRVVTVGHISDALSWGLSPAGTVPRRRAS